jgi:hypothetical protein
LSGTVVSGWHSRYQAVIGQYLASFTNKKITEIADNFVLKRSRWHQISGKSGFCAPVS